MITKSSLHTKDGHIDIITSLNSKHRFKYYKIGHPFTAPNQPSLGLLVCSPLRSHGTCSSCSHDTRSPCSRVPPAPCNAPSSARAAPRSAPSPAHAVQPPLLRGTRSLVPLGLRAHARRPRELRGTLWRSAMVVARKSEEASRVNLGFGFSGE